MGKITFGSDSNRAMPRSHPAVTPSTDLSRSQLPGHFGVLSLNRTLMTVSSGKLSQVTVGMAPMTGGWSIDLEGALGAGSPGVIE